MNKMNSASTIRRKEDRRLEDLYCALFYSLCDSQICRLSICDYASFSRGMYEIDYPRQIIDYYKAFNEITNEFDNSFDKSEFIQFMKNSNNNNNNNNKRKQTKLQQILHNWVRVRYNKNNNSDNSSRSNNNNEIVMKSLLSARMMDNEVLLPTPLYNQMVHFYNYMFFGNVECNFECFYQGMYLCGFGGVSPEQVFCEIIECGKNKFDKDRDKDSKDSASNSSTTFGSKSSITNINILNYLEDGCTFGKREFIKYCYCDINKIGHTMPYLFIFVAQNPHMWQNRQQYHNNNNNNNNNHNNNHYKRSQNHQLRLNQINEINHVNQLNQTNIHHIHHVRSNNRSNHVNVNVGKINHADHVKHVNHVNQQANVYRHHVQRI